MNRTPAVVAALVLLAALWLSSRELAPPDVVPATAPPEAFSAERAAAHLSWIARAPHPLGSEELERVRDRLLEELRGLGLAPQVVASTVVLERPFDVRGATVENVQAVVPGSRGGGPLVVLACHYDSVKTGPGAGDDGAGVAALLEAARALRASPPLANDVLLLFTDGEEAALFGARAFVAGDPLAARVSVIVNLEARGHRGPSVLFETSTGNARLIEAFAGAVRHPVGNSLGYEVYRRMPNDTDLSVFRRAGLGGMNFGFIGGLTHYHTALDSVANLDLRSLQHHGENALALARRFGDADLAALDDGRDRAYAAVARAFVVHHPASWTAAVAGAPLLLLAAALVLGFARGHLRARALVHGALGVVLAVALPAGAGFALGAVLEAAQEPLATALRHRQPALLCGLALLVAGLALLVLLRWRGRASVAGLLAGAALLLAAATVAAAAVAPLAVLVFALPQLGLSLALLVMAGRGRPAPLGPGAVLAIGGCLMPLPVLLGPLVVHLAEAMTLFAPAACAVTAGLAALVVAGLAPLLLTLCGTWRRLPPVLLSLAGLAGLAVVLLRADVSEERPLADDLHYLFDVDRLQAWFGTLDAEPDAWTSRFLAADADRGVVAGFEAAFPWPLLHSAAPPAILDAPRVEVLGETGTGDAEASVVLRVHAPRGARRLVLRFDGMVSLRRWNDHVFAEEGGRAVAILRHEAVPDEGLVLELVGDVRRVRGATSFAIYDDLPELPGDPLPARPPWIIERPYPGDSSIVRRTLRW